MLGALLLSCVFACSSQPTRTIVLATTTSLDDSGLLTALLPAFAETQPEIDVRVVSVGSGQALALGRAGDADVLLVHSPADEATFMKEGHGITRDVVMTNDFVIVGPPADPAGVRGASDVVTALTSIAAKRATWVSRGDNSGTHRAEQRMRALLRDSAQLQVLEVGQGMAETLTLTAERAAYTLTDRATYLSMKKALPLDVLVEGDIRLRNVYSVITARRARNPDDAASFAQWLLTRAAQQRIAMFGRERYGRSLFTPMLQEAVLDGPAR